MARQTEAPQWLVEAALRDHHANAYLALGRSNGFTAELFAEMAQHLLVANRDLAKMATEALERSKPQIIVAVPHEVSAELAALRLIVTEKFASADFHVKPEDAADVLRFARNMDSVRYLIGFTPSRDNGEVCMECGSALPEHWAGCRVFLAWAALDDPRAAEAIGAAFDRAMTDEARRRDRAYADRRFPDEPPFQEWAWRTGPNRLASESEQAARQRHFEPIPAEYWGTPIAEVMLSRRESDARGMEAVEDDARAEHRSREAAAEYDDETDELRASGRLGA